MGTEGTEDANDGHDWPEWCVRQTVPGGRACVWVLAPSAAAAVTIANHLASRTGDWPVGPDVELEVFLRSEYPEHCDRGDFTFTIIDRPVRQAWLEKRMRPEGEHAPSTSGR